MIENIIKLYKEYGGIKSIILSWYFLIALTLSILSSSSVGDSSWADLATGALPSLTGFTVAAFALSFAVLGPKRIQLLTKRDKDGKSPIVSIVTAIGHAVLIQIFALVIAITVTLSDASALSNSLGLSEHHTYVLQNIGLAFSCLGLLFTYYGILLILAAALSIVRLQIIVADST